MPATLELVTFRLLRPDSDGFVAANAAVSAWLSQQPGFVSRHLAEVADGSFVDIVFWQSHEAAMAASEKLPGELGEDEAMAMIDPMSVKMVHGAVRLSVD